MTLVRTASGRPFCAAYGHCWFLEVRTVLFEVTVVHINREELGKRRERALIKKLDYTFSLVFTKNIHH